MKKYLTFGFRGIFLNMEVLFFQIASLSYTIKRKQYEIYNHSAVFGQTIPLSFPFF